MTAAINLSVNKKKMEFTIAPNILIFNFHNFPNMILQLTTILSVIAITLGILVLFQSTNYVTAQGGNGNVTGAKFLFIQSAQSGLVSELNATTSTLELNDVSDKTVVFSDRPDRIVRSVNTTNFIGNWSSGPDSFAVDPPNAVLIVGDEIEGEQRQDYAVIELFNPQYDSEANTLRYDIAAENATTTPINLPGEFGQSTLVIDEEGCSGCGGCCE
jgi:hypothetical protein